MCSKLHNLLLLAGIASGVLALPMTWVTYDPAISSGPGFFSDWWTSTFSNGPVAITGLNGRFHLPVGGAQLWFIISLAIGANVLQLLNNLKAIVVSRFIVRRFAVTGFIMVAFPVLMVLVDQTDARGIGWLLAAICASIPVCRLCFPIAKVCAS